MNVRGKTMRTWLPPIVSVASVALAGGYAVSRQSRAAEGIRSLLSTGSTLSNAAAAAQSGVLSQQDEEALKARCDDLEQRLRDSHKPALVQAQLVEFARSLDLEVREVQPISAAGKKTESTDLRAYRVTVAGQYAQIAAYMSALPKQRIPARVIALRLGARRGDETDTKAGLSAEFTVEVFHEAERRLAQAAAGAAEAKQ